VTKINNSTSDVLTLAEAANLLKVCEKTAGKLAQTGELPARRVGNQWRFSRRAVLAHIEGDSLPPATHHGEPGAAGDTLAAATGAAEDCR